MKIGIVNDMAMASELLRRAVEADGHEVIWTASNGREAVSKQEEKPADLLLMDLIMPVMCGVEATRRILASQYCPILVVTASVEGQSDLVYEALGAGALDAVDTPNLKSGDWSPLHKKLKTLSRLLPSPTRRASSGDRLVLLGSSSGGPRALLEILQRLKADFESPILIAQHLDADFVPGLASWLDAQTDLKVRVASDGCKLEPGTALLSPGGRHLVLTRSRRLRALQPQGECLQCPSVDLLFSSAAKHWTGPKTGVLLTGMGRDGAEGLLALRQSGGQTVAQSQETCVVFGMPRAAIELEAAQHVLDLRDIPEFLLGEDQ